MKVVTDEAAAKLADGIRNLSSTELPRKDLGPLGSLTLDSGNHEAVLSVLVGFPGYDAQKNCLPGMACCPCHGGRPSGRRHSCSSDRTGNGR